MDLFINIAILGLATILSFSAIGGETWRKDDVPLLQKLTCRGWLAVACLILGLALGTVKEWRSDIKSQREERLRIDAEATFDRRFREATEKIKERERSIAMSLYAYTHNMTSLLEAISPDSFLVGYRLFSSGNLEGAKARLEQSYKSEKYVAPSRYLQAYMLTHDEQGELRLGKEEDWKRALEYLGESITYDSKYTPAFYLRAVIRANTNALDLAWADLEQAVMPERYGITNCYDINDSEETKKFFARVLEVPDSKSRLEQIQRKCLMVHPKVKGHVAIVRRPSSGK